MASGDISLSSAVTRGFFGRCPNCGSGKLFKSYLKPVDKCSVCCQALGRIRADDGPEWATILVVGHILAPVLLRVLPNNPWPDWFAVGGTCASYVGPDPCAAAKNEGPFHRDNMEVSLRPFGKVRSIELDTHALRVWVNRDRVELAASPAMSAMRPASGSKFRALAAPRRAIAG